MANGVPAYCSRPVLGLVVMLDVSSRPACMTTVCWKVIALSSVRVRDGTQQCALRTTMPHLKNRTRVQAHAHAQSAEEVHSGAVLGLHDLLPAGHIN